MKPLDIPPKHRRSQHSAALLAMMLSSGLAFAQTHDHAHGAPAEPPAAAPTALASSGLPWTEAEVRRVDATAGKLSLKHGEIKNLDMPPMTMVFQLQDPALLGALKPGDRVRFTAEQVNGSYTVRELQAVSADK